ncbi:hypothetical protein GGR33_003117 [Methylobacterium brachythecii]|uniref:Uncharacterized protein n=1 Tax=Methylobacterium brachythecii TaxID=1176177 RepID=A0A7W6AHT9_9HYPH|nr:hypothetical protein [Methylobacterium brachythecii]
MPDVIARLVISIVLLLGTAYLPSFNVAGHPAAQVAAPVA